MYISGAVTAILAGLLWGRWEVFSRKTGLDAKVIPFSRPLFGETLNSLQITGRLFILVSGAVKGYLTTQAGHPREKSNLHHTSLSSQTAEFTGHIVFILLIQSLKKTAIKKINKPPVFLEGLLIRRG